MEYWIAKISFFKGNPEHKYIVMINGDSVEVGFIDASEWHNIRDFNSFKLIKQIKL